MESHTLVTEDGYELTLHRIPYSTKYRRHHYPSQNNPFNSNEVGIESGSSESVKAQSRGDRMNYAFDTRGKPAVFLQHGVLASSLDWVLTGPHKALGEWRKVTSDQWVFYGMVRGLGKKRQLDQLYLHTGKYPDSTLRMPPPCSVSLISFLHLHSYLYAVVSTRLRTFEKRMLRRIIGPIRDQAAGEWRKSLNLYPSRIFSGWTDQRRCVGWDMHYNWENEKILQNLGW